MRDTRREDLGDQLHQAGLISARELGAARARGGGRSALLRALRAAGLDDQAFIGFCLSRMALASPVNLQEIQPEPEALEHLAAQTAHALLMLPLELTAAGLQVAMADPGDREALRAGEREAGCPLLPRLAPIGAVQAAIDAAYPEPAPIALVRRKATPTDRAAETEAEAELPSADSAAPEPSAGEALPLVKRRPPSGAIQRQSSTAKYGERPSRATAAYEAAPEAAEQAASMPDAPDAALERVEPAGQASQAADAHGAARRASPAPEGSADAARGRRKSAPTWRSKQRLVGPGATRPPRPGKLLSPEGADSAFAEAAPPIVAKAPPLPDVSSTLAALRSASDRDGIVRLACEAAASTCRSALLLALRRNVLKGWDGEGAVEPSALHNIWIPASSPSIFRRPVADGAPHRGPYGKSAADNLFRTATHSRGGEVVVAPILVSGRVIAVLCADGLTHGDLGEERILQIAALVGEAFHRLIASGKTP
ncbi:MAG: hypothetical protein OEY14_13855 [Myxococcales bacterium]|nr:hypothetical protein [Myxococcales bacterium]